MATFDVRKDIAASTTLILFADTRGGGFEEYSQGYSIRKAVDFRSGIQIDDEDEGFILISTKQHALDLIKALEKAIELKWLK